MARTAQSFDRTARDMRGGDGLAISTSVEHHQLAGGAGFGRRRRDEEDSRARGTASGILAVPPESESSQAVGGSVHGTDSAAARVHDPQLHPLTRTRLDRQVGASSGGIRE